MIRADRLHFLAMPWKEVTTMEEITQFVSHALSGHFAVDALLVERESDAWGKSRLICPP